MTSGDLVEWEELYQELVPINKAIKNEFFVTWAVCHGNFFMSSAYLNPPAAFRGLVGSFETIYETDLKLRFYDFYEELFWSLNFNKAYEALAKANPNMPNSFRCFSAEMIFAMAWNRYEKDLTIDSALEQRAKQLFREKPLDFPQREITEHGILDLYKKNLNAYTQRLFEHDYVPPSSCWTYIPN